MKRTVWLVQTKHGWLGKRRYNYKEGTTVASDASFKFARVFSRKQDADVSCERGDTVVEGTLTC